MRLGKMHLGKMRLGEMLPNQMICVWSSMDAIINSGLRSVCSLFSRCPTLSWTVISLLLPECLTLIVMGQRLDRTQRVDGNGGGRGRTAGWHVFFFGPLCGQITIVDCSFLVGCWLVACCIYFELR